MKRTPAVYHELSRSGAAIAFAVAIATFLTVAIVLSPLLPAAVVGIAASTAGFALVPWLSLHRQGGLGRIGLHWPQRRPLIGGVLIGLGLWYLNAQLAMPVARWLGTDPQALVDSGEAIASAPAIALIVGLMLVPAISEEIAFRGLLLRGALVRWPPAAALVTQAGLFALLHIEPSRWLPTFVVGLATGVVARKHGLVPAMALHLTNNFGAVAWIAAAPIELQVWAYVHPRLAIALFAIPLVLGVVLIRSGANKERDS